LNIAFSDDLLFAGGLAEEVTADVLKAVFLPFGKLKDINLPLDYETGTWCWLESLY
jgi:hypothetical protein